MTVKMGPSYASDLFGTGSDDLVLGYEEGADPEVHLRLGAAVAANTRADITLTLSGATFASSVRRSDLAVAYLTHPCVDDGEGGTEYGAGVPMAIPTQPALTVSITDGRRGDNEVQFDVSSGAEIALGTGDPTGTGCTVGTDTVDSGLVLLFTLPTVTGAGGSLGPGGRGVMITATVDPQTNQGGLEEFPSRSQLAASPGTAGGSRLTIIGPTYGTNAGGNIVPENPAMTVTDGTPEAAGSVNVADRTQLFGLPTSRTSQHLVLGAMVVSIGEHVQSDGSAFSVEPKEDGAGVLDLTVSGNVREGDMVIFDLDGDGKADRGEELDYVAAHGVFWNAFDLDDLLSDAEGEPTNMFGGQPRGRVLYFPDGETEMRSGNLVLAAKVVYEQGSNVPPFILPNVKPLSYSVGASARAYALAPVTDGGDESNLRIRCESNRACNVWLSCDSAMGENFFGKMSNPVMPWGTTTVSSGMIAEVVGADATDDFMGRMSCEVIGGGLAVQVLTRSGGTLVNNTYVEGP